MNISKLTMLRKYDESYSSYIWTPDIYSELVENVDIDTEKNRYLAKPQNAILVGREYPILVDYQNTGCQYFAIQSHTGYCTGARAYEMYISRHRDQVVNGEFLYITLFPAILLIPDEGASEMLVAIFEILGSGELVFSEVAGFSARWIYEDELNLTPDQIQENTMDFRGAGRFII